MLFGSFGPGISSSCYDPEHHGAPYLAEKAGRLPTLSHVAFWDPARGV